MRQIAGDRHSVDHPIKQEGTHHDTDDLADMDLGRVIEGGERGAPVRPHQPAPTTAHAGVPPAYRTYEGARPGLSNVAATQQMPSSGEVWAGALHRLQAQVSLNTSMLESHRRQVGDVEQAVGRLQQEMGNVVAVLHEMRAELHARPQVMEAARHDSGDMDVLTSQIASVTSKANEVDGLKMQVELMKNRMKRFEEHGSPARPGTSSTHHEMYESTPMSAQHAMQGQHLPPMRTASTIAPPADRMYGGPAPNVLPSQGQSVFQSRPELRIPSNDRPAVPPAQSSGYRPAEPLPPPSALSGWRPADTHSLPPPAQQSEASVPFRSHPVNQEAAGSGWAVVNSAIKRPFEEQQHQSPYGPPSAPGSPKRPRLAPIMPRSSLIEENSPFRPSSMQQMVMPAPPDISAHSRSRAQSNSSQSQSQSQMLPTPASANTSAYRFITSTAEVDMQVGWRPEPESMEQPAPPSAGRGKGKGSRRRGGGRGRGSRGGAQHRRIDSQELGAVDPQSTEQTGSQASPSEYPSATDMMSGGFAYTNGSSADRPEHAEFPATPVSGQYPDTFGTQADLLLSNSSKKSRSKPTRNADGVLIRKDGRPDMRSVSSANNLRKVHAKREAERAEADGKIPTSVAPALSNLFADDEHEARSGTPDSTGVDDGDVDDQGAQERHQQLMGRIYPHGAEHHSERQSTGARSGAHQAEVDTVMKEEEHGEGGIAHARPVDAMDAGIGDRSADVAMRDMSGSAERRLTAGDGRMAPILETTDREMTGAENVQAPTAEQSAEAVTEQTVTTAQ
ncbi:hypothetical protein LTR27_010996 [Elasticomyces elasticus]|nr:hypothetical protein LTR27_010996 [Elasticomyces elasticus]